VRRVVVGNDRLDQQQPTIIRDRGADGAQDGECLLVIPVVDDVRQQLAACSWRQRVGEEVAGHDVAAIREAVGGQLGPGPGNGPVELGQDATHAGVCLQDGGDEPAVMRGWYGPSLP
jgi:hypothetical protein